MSDAEGYLSPANCEAARNLLRLNQEELAAVAKVSVATLRKFEGGAGASNLYAARQILTALEREGVEFIGANGDPKLR